MRYSGNGKFGPSLFKPFSPECSRKDNICMRKRRMFVMHFGMKAGLKNISNVHDRQKTTLEGLKNTSHMEER